MKKFTIIVACLMFVSYAYGAINTSWNTIQDNVHGNLKFNVNVGTEEEPDYYPLQVKIDVPVRTADGKGRYQVTITKNVGTNQEEPFDFSTIQGLKDIYTALPTFAKGAFKEAIIEALNENVSE